MNDRPYLRRAAFLPAALSGAALVLGCSVNDKKASVIDASVSSQVDAASVADAAIRQCENVDVVFVIDNSFSMLNEIDNLVAAFPSFAESIDGLTTDEGVAIDYRIGVITPGATKTIDITRANGTTTVREAVGNDGVLLDNDCDLPMPWLEKGDPDLVENFSCVADLGLDGSPDEMPLEALRLSLVESEGSNQGFFRDDALLAMVILTDEDDCSFISQNPQVVLGEGEGFCDHADGLAKYRDAYDSLKGKDRWALALIAVLDEEDCPDDGLAITEAERLQQFVSANPGSSVSASICAADLTPALQTAFDTFEVACEQLPQID